MADAPAFLPHIARMTGYLPGEQPRDGDILKLNTNENPYPASPQVMEALHGAVGENLRKYPDAGCHGIRARLADLFDLPPEQFVVGNGSDELLNVAVRCFAGAGDAVAYATPSYPYYEKLIDLQDARSVTVEFDDDYELPDLAGLQAAMILVPNPNSPSGTAVSSERLDDLAARAQGLLIVDEAYVDFARQGAVDLVRRHANVVVVRTLSKSFSLAGVRLGFCVAAPEVAAGLWKVKEHYNVNSLSQAAAEAALDDIDWMRDNARRIVDTRTTFTGQLRTMGFHVWESEANFVLARVPDGGEAGRFYEGLKQRGILVRYFPTNPRLADCLRISIGTDEQMQRVAEELRGMLT